MTTKANASTVTIDLALQQEIDAAMMNPGQRVRATFKLRSTNGLDQKAQRNKFKITAEKILSEVQQSTGLKLKKDDTTIYQSLGIVLVTADPMIISELAKQSEFSHANLVRSTESSSAFIPPVESRPTTLDEISK